MYTHHLLLGILLAGIVIPNYPSGLLADSSKPAVKELKSDNRDCKEGEVIKRKDAGKASGIGGENCDSDNRTRAEDKSGPKKKIIKKAGTAAATGVAVKVVKDAVTGD